MALTDSLVARERVEKARRVIADKVSSEKSVYGVSTGFGGSGKFRSLSAPGVLHISYIFV